jgi:hypothetical protein
MLRGRTPAREFLSDVRSASPTPPSASSYFNRALRFEINIPAKVAGRLPFGRKAGRRAPPSTFVSCRCIRDPPVSKTKGSLKKFRNFGCQFL